MKQKPGYKIQGPKPGESALSSIVRMRTESSRQPAVVQRKIARGLNKGTAPASSGGTGTAATVPQDIQSYQNRLKTLKTPQQFTQFLKDAEAAQKTFEDGIRSGSATYPNAAARSEEWRNVRSEAQRMMRALGGR